MDDFKISLFEEEYSQDFPSYKTLSKAECDRLSQGLVTKYSLDNKMVEESLSEIQDFYNEADASSSFELIKTFHKAGICFEKSIFINWYKFERVDEIATESMDKYFYDIWFSVSDDIDLFDSSLSWVMSIRHDGAIFILK